MKLNIYLFSETIFQNIAVVCCFLHFIKYRFAKIPKLCDWLILTIAFQFYCISAQTEFISRSSGASSPKHMSYQIKLQIQEKEWGMTDEQRLKQKSIQKEIFYELVQLLIQLNSMTMEKIESQCFICGNLQCVEQSDHKKLTFTQFDNLLKQKAGYQPEIDKIKNKIRKCFKSIQKSTNQQMGPYVNELFLLVDKLHFWHLLRFSNSLKNVQAVIFGLMIPRNQMITLLHYLNQEPDRSIVFPKFDRLLYEIHKFKKFTKKVSEKSNYGELFITFSNIIQKCEAEFNSQCRAKKLQLPAPFNQEAVPTNEVEQTGIEYVLIQGIPFSTMRQNVDLSVLQITDSLLVGYLPSLEKMKNLNQLQIRNNKLTKRGYTMLFNALPHLQSLDVSCSSSDYFYEILGEKLPNIKTLYLNQTNLTDEKLIKVTEKLENLKVLYADLNQITSSGVSEMFQVKRNIIFSSLKGNKISEQCANGIQLNLIYKGGYLQY